MIAQEARRKAIWNSLPKLITNAIIDTIERGMLETGPINIDSIHDSDIPILIINLQILGYKIDHNYVNGSKIINIEFYN